MEIGCARPFCILLFFSFCLHIVQLDNLLILFSNFVSFRFIARLVPSNFYDSGINDTFTCHALELENSE